MRKPSRTVTGKAFTVRVYSHLEDGKYVVDSLVVQSGNVRHAMHGDQACRFLGQLDEAVDDSVDELAPLAVDLVCEAEVCWPYQSGKIAA